MLSSKFVLALLTVAFAPLLVLATPHPLNHALHHRIAARALAFQNVSVPNVRRQSNDRCRQRSSSSSDDSLTTSQQLRIPSTPSSSPTPSPFEAPSPSPTASPFEPPSPSHTHSHHHSNAPSPTPSEAPSPSPTPSPSEAPSPSPSSSSPSTPNADGTVYSGQATFYDVGLGACGDVNTDSQNILAVSQLLFDGFDGYTGGDPNGNPVCNKQIQIFYQGKSVTATVKDRCTGCQKTDLDLSPTLFAQIANPSLGRVDITWQFI